MCLFSLATFKIFPFVSDIQMFNCNTSWHGFPWVYSVWCLFNFLNLYIVSFTKFGKFSLLFLQEVYLFYFLSPCPFETLMIWMLDILLLSYRSLSLCLSCVNIFFFSVVKIGWVLVFSLSSSSLIWSPVISALLLSPSSKFFYLLFFSSSISTWKLLQLLFLSWDFLFVHLFQENL